MATASSAVYSATITAASIAGSGKTTAQKTKVKFISGLNSFGGLKAHSNVVSLGFPICTEHSFAKIVSSLRQPLRGGGGGALSSTCNAAGEIFRIAAIMPALVLVGVAVGFVLLRLEATKFRHQISSSDGDRLLICRLGILLGLLIGVPEEIFHVVYDGDVKRTARAPRDFFSHS